MIKNQLCKLRNTRLIYETTKRHVRCAAHCAKTACDIALFAPPWQLMLLRLTHYM